ncbi:hypothetical protein [Hafnia sp. HMSC23F03]|uniref:hypothetical protein n=1 Tax=Hafnia sp. HMSC23F03 TaxID=1581059 RepID=UPI0008A4800B|nr:hypothetical protein [Hafnia sp. HMSC23F03]OFS11908.1 hypothetical protein HMPREF3091_04205 [Hafnia sp. HMSC23F03]
MDNNVSELSLTEVARLIDTLMTCLTIEEGGASLANVNLSFIYDIESRFEARFISIEAGVPRLTDQSIVLLECIMLHAKHNPDFLFSLKEISELGCF